MVHFKSSEFQPMIKVQMFTFSDFVSNVGGFMGLLAGVSFVSIIEVVYVAIESKRQRNQVQPLMPPNVTRRVAWGNETHVLYQLSRFFFEFIESSDIHGARRLSDKRQDKCGRIFWTLLVASSIIVCSITIVNMIRNAEKSPVFISIDAQARTLDEV
jgi:Amiloride-sensitive sodium channel